MSNLFDQFAGKLRGSPFVIWVVLLTVVMFLIGINFFVEDTVSSRNGIAQLEAVFGVKPVNFQITYISLSIAPQVAQVVLLYMFFTDNKKNRWALVIAALFFALDFVSDLQDRSNGHFLPLTGGINLDTQTAVSAGFTLMAYTIASEMFVSVSVGLFLVLFADSITQYAILVVQIKNAWKQARDKIDKAHNYNTNQGRGGQSPQHNQPRDRSGNMAGGRQPHEPEPARFHLDGE